MNGQLHPGSQYTDDQRREVISQYIVLGNVTKTAEVTGIPRTTIEGWKSNCDWWESELVKIRQQKQEELDASYTNIIHAVQKQVIDRVENGDYVIDKQGELTRKPMTGKDLTMVGAIQFDKRQIMRNLPTSISSSNSQQLQDLAAQFSKLANTKVIEGTCTQSEDNQSVTPDTSADT